MNIFLKITPATYDDLRRELDGYLCRDRKLPVVELRTFWIDEGDEIEMINNADYEIFNIFCEGSNPTSSPERSPLFILREKPKRFYSRKKKLDSKKSSDPILETPDLDYNDIEKKDTHNENEGVVETRISENYNWDEDDNDLFLSISTQEILDQNNFPSTSKRAHKFPANKQITQGNQRSNKNLVLSESNFALGFQKARLGEDKNELDEVTNKMHQDEEGKVNNSVISHVSAGFKTANGKRISISEEGHKSVQNILREFQGNLQETDYENELKDIKARISNKSFQTATRKREFQGYLQEKDDEIKLKAVKDQMECKFKKIAKSNAQVDKNTDFETSSKEEGASVSSNQSETKTEDLETYQKDLKSLISNMGKIKHWFSNG
uniref:PB1 domain-containing protein n=1 Tax=Glossina morsitans morsitans TaxID=37546 RepID=A0A1B0G2C9_GLOMM